MNLLKISLITGVCIAASSCAVSHREVVDMRDQKTEAANQKIADGKRSQRQESSLTRINGNYLGDATMDLPASATLPSVFFDKVSLHSKMGGFGTVTQAAKNLSLATGVPIYVSADVENPPGANAQAAAQAITSSPMAPLDLNIPLSSKPPSQSLAAGAQARSSSKNLVNLDYQGSMLSYIKMMTSAAGVDWEYRDGAITIRRMITKVFTLSSISPGDIDVADSMTKSGSSTTGQQGGLTPTTSGNFNSTSSVGMKGAYSLWKLLKPALDSALTVGGKLSINEGSGTITVTDTKDAVARVEKILERENAILGRQVSIDVRVIRVGVNNETQAGVNLNAVYSLFTSSGAVANAYNLSGPSTQTTSAAGSLSFAVSNPSSSFNGTALAIQGLNQFGNIISDSSSSVTTTNRVPAMTGSYTTRGFLAQTTPAAGGGVSGGQGVPGLTPGSTTTGSFLRVLPTIRENNTILLNMSVDISNLLGFGSASTGVGATLQQIQWANTDGTKTTSNLVLNQEESMVMVGIGSDDLSSTLANGIGGGSMGATRSKQLFVVVVTPRIMKGI